MRRVLASVVLLMAVGSTTSAEEPPDEVEPPAATPAQQQARAKFREGDRHYAVGNYDGAVASFKEAIALDAALPGPWRNLGLVYIALKQCEPAVEAFTAYLKLRPTGKWTTRVEQWIARCKGPVPSPIPLGSTTTELALVSIGATSGGKPLEGAVVRVDGLIRGGTPLDLQMTPGRHTVRLEKQGYEPAEKSVEIAPNGTEDIAIELRASVDTTPARPAVVVVAPKPPGKTRRPLAWGLLTAAAVAYVAGGACGILESATWREAQNLDRMSHPRADLDALRGRGATLGAVAWTGYTVGTAALLVGVVLFLVDVKRGEAKGDAALALVPQADGSTSAVLRW